MGKTTLQLVITRLTVVCLRLVPDLDLRVCAASGPSVFSGHEMPGLGW